MGAGCDRARLLSLRNPLCEEAMTHRPCYSVTLHMIFFYIDLFLLGLSTHQLGLHPHKMERCHSVLLQYITLHDNESA